MQQAPTECSEQHPQSSNLPEPFLSSQDGSHHHDPSGPPRARSAGSSSASPRSAVDHLRRDSLQGVNADQLDEKLRGLSLGPRPGGCRPPAPGQRISEYENALTPPTPKQALGFKVIKRRDSHYDGPQIEHFPTG